MVSIYRNHDRELMFHGTVEEARAKGIRVRWDERTVKINGQWRKIVNHATEAHYLGLWVA